MRPKFLGDSRYFSTNSAWQGEGMKGQGRGEGVRTSGFAHWFSRPDEMHLLFVGPWVHPLALFVDGLRVWHITCLERTAAIDREREQGGAHDAMSCHGGGLDRTVVVEVLELERTRIQLHRCHHGERPLVPHLKVIVPVACAHKVVSTALEQRAPLANPTPPHPTTTAGAPSSHARAI